MAIRTVGIDIAKSVFHLVALDEKGSVVVKKKFSRPQLLVYTANLRAEVIGMEACSGSHYLARILASQGHDVRLMPAEYVRPYVKSNKNDFIDAEAIADTSQLVGQCHNSHIGMLPYCKLVHPWTEAMLRSV